MGTRVYLLPFPITIGTQAPGGTGGHITLDSGASSARREACPAPPSARHHAGRQYRPARLRSGQDALDRHRGSEWPAGHQRDPAENRLGDLGAVHARADGGRGNSGNGGPASSSSKRTAIPSPGSSYQTNGCGNAIHGRALAPLKLRASCCTASAAFAVVRLRRAGANTGQIADMVGMSEQMVKRYSRFSRQRENALAAVHYLDRTKPEQPKSDRSKNNVNHWNCSPRHIGNRGRGQNRSCRAAVAAAAD